MSQLEGFEEAFDNLIQGQPSSAADTNADPMDSEVELLKVALFEENLAAVQTLLVLRHDLPRPYLCAALCGACRYLLHIAVTPQDKQALNDLAAILTTKKGQPKKLLRDHEWERLTQSCTPLTGKPAQSALQDMNTYIQVLTGLNAIDPTDVCRLFAVGLWRPDRLLQSHIAESAHLANLSAEKLTVLHKALTEYQT